MADKILQTRIQIKRDPSEKWNISQPILQDGEVGFITDTNEIKIGKNNTPWNGLVSFKDETYINNQNETYLQKAKTYADTKIASTDKGVANGVAELDENGKILSEQLPSYVDDVVEGTLATFVKPGEAGKIYVDTSTNLSYRWSGSDFTVISPSLALGTTATTAFRGDWGQALKDQLNGLSIVVSTTPPPAGTPATTITIVTE